MKFASVVYVGPALSGRRTSLAKILSAASQPCNPLTLKTDVAYECVLADRCVSVSISYKRSMMPSQHPSAQSSSDIQREKEWLTHADGVVFVVDSLAERLEANAEQLERLRSDLAANNIALDAIPIVFQANKRDLRNAVPIETLRRDFRTKNSVMVESVAVRGVGTSEAFLALLGMIRDGGRFFDQH